MSVSDEPNESPAADGDASRPGTVQYLVRVLGADVAAFIANTDVGSLAPKVLHDENHVLERARLSEVAHAFAVVESSAGRDTAASWTFGMNGRLGMAPALFAREATEIAALSVIVASAEEFIEH